MKGSILQNTNRLISSSETSWGSIRENSLVRFVADNNYYTVGSIGNFLYLKDFITLSSNTVKINNDINAEMAIGETINLSYKEYEILTLDSLDNGQGYKISDVLITEGGIASTEIGSGQSLPARFIVSSIEGDGVIKQLRMESGGKYIVSPDIESLLVGGSGKGCKVKLTIKNTDSQTLLEKTIINISKGAGATVLTFDSGLPIGVSSGKISVNKWQALLTSNYAGSSKISEEIEFLKDFSPFLRIPLVAKNNKNPEIVYNTALLEIDKRMREMFEEIQRLKAAKP